MKVKKILAIIFFFAACTAFSEKAFASQSYRDNGGSTLTVNEWSECRVVTNQAGAKDTFIPTNTTIEWSEFRIHYPSHISLAPCSNTLSITKAGTGGGSATSSPSGISCGSTCNASYASGTAITLTAAASTGSIFAGWSGGGCSGTGTCTVTLTSDTIVTATFNLITYALTVTKAGTGGGSATSSPSGISCGSTCNASYASGTAITLTAAASTGSIFAGWSGGGCSGTGTCTVTLTSDTTVTATFNTVNYTLNVTKSGFGAGTLTSSPSGINCGSTCGASFGGGSSITLTATPNAGSKFAGWSGGGCSGTGTCTVTLNANTTVDAKFNPADCKITPPGGKKIFVSSITYGGSSIRNETAANTICKSLATGAGLGGTDYKAFIYLNGSMPASVLKSGYTFYNGKLTANGCEWFVVATGVSNFFTANGSGNYLSNPIRYDQTGTEQTYNVWTNFQPNGSGSYMVRNMDPDAFTPVSCCGYGSIVCWPCVSYYKIYTGAPAYSGTAYSKIYYGSSQSVTIAWAGTEWSKPRNFSSSFTPKNCDAAAVVWPECDTTGRAMYCVEQ